MNVDFLIIGAQKSGTTSLYNWLARHPSIILPSEKEVHFFSRENNYIQGDKFLSAYFKIKDNRKITGFADVQLLFLDDMAKKVYDYLPSVKLIVVLRNPIDRAYSAYWFARRNGIEKRQSFEDAITDELQGISSETLHKQEAMSYLKHGYYAEQLESYLEFFEKKNIKAVFTEKLRDNPKITFLKVLEFLNCSTNEYALSNVDFSKLSNTSSIPKIRWLQQMLHTQDSQLKNRFRNIFSNSQRKWIREYFLNKIGQVNLRSYNYKPMSGDTRILLREHYKDHNQKLKNLLSLNTLNWE